MRSPGDDARLREQLVRAAAGAAAAPVPVGDQVEEALSAMGHPVNARAEELEPREFVQLAELLA